jgi:tetratricopeptide (TPR) repeat protein
MEIYNPLRGGSELYRIYSTSLARELPEGAEEERRAELLRRYRPYALRLARARGVEGPPVELEEDERELVGVFRRFFAEVSGRILLGPAISRVPILFPQTPVSDGRVGGEGSQAAVYISSGKLDALELFAGTVSICARLNEMAVAGYVEVGEPSVTDIIPLPWLSLVGDAAPWLNIGGLLESDADVQQVAREVFGPNWPDSPIRRAAFARQTMSRCLLHLMMRAIRQGAESGWAAVPELPDVASPIDRRYLAVLALTFVIFHEIGHILGGHNEIGLRPPMEPALEPMISAFQSTAGPGEDVFDLTGAVASSEISADLFAIEQFDGKLREPMLDAASLWCTAHERAHKVTGDRGGDLLHMFQHPDDHPSFALRVWQMNGRMQAEYRPLEIARTIVAAAENAATELWGRGPSLPDRELWLYQTVLDLARTALADQAWTPPVTDPEPDRGRPVMDALTEGLHAWDAGRLDEAEAALRSAAAMEGTDHEIGTAHVLLGRLLEARGHPSEAEAEYQRADALGHEDAANELGLLAKRRGDLDEAEAMFRRADDRGSAVGAFNLGEMLEARGDRLEALQAFGQADARGNADAALALGYLARDDGDLDRAEAAWGRADARGAKTAATCLGAILYQAGDINGAEDAWRRGAARDELESLHNLGFLLDQQDRVDEAAAVFAEAVAHGRTASINNLERVRNRVRKLDEGEKRLRRRMKRGDAEAAYNLAHVLLLRGRPRADVVSAMETAERLGHPGAAYKLGVFLILFKDPQAAQDALRRAAGRGHPQATAALGSLLHEQGDLDEAFDLWSRADQLGDPGAATCLGDSFRRTGDLQSALAAYQRADSRGDPAGASALGRLLEHQGDLEGAKAAYGRAEDRGDYAAAAHLGDLLHRQGDSQAAAQAWHRADLAGDADAAEKLGLLLHELGNADAAEAALHRAHARRHPEALPVFDYLRTIGDTDFIRAALH